MADKQTLGEKRRAYNGPAILNAVRRSGRSGQVKIVCFDEEDETLAGVASGEIFATVVQQPFEFGRQAITRMAQYLQGDTSALAGVDPAEFAERVKAVIAPVAEQDVAPR